MKIAVPLTNENAISDHFGQSDYFGVFSVSGDSEISGMQKIIPDEGAGCKSNIASTLATDGVTVLLAAGMGTGALNKFTRNGISVIRGCSGEPSQLVREYLSGNLEDTGSSCHKHSTSIITIKPAVQHHHHEHGHSCGCGTSGHSCGCN
jgi:predicted Fe-Mo cluster-binding NifX family protein